MASWQTCVCFPLENFWTLNVVMNRIWSWQTYRRYIVDPVGWKGSGCTKFQASVQLPSFMPNWQDLLLQKDHFLRTGFLLEFLVTWESDRCDCLHSQRMWTQDNNGDRQEIEKELFCVNRRTILTIHSPSICQDEILAIIKWCCSSL